MFVSDFTRFLERFFLMLQDFLKSKKRKFITEATARMTCL